MTIPMLVTAFVVMFNAGNLWLASYEAHKAFEAGALAGVQQWGENGDTAANRLDSRNLAVTFVGANTAIGTTIVITNNDGANDVNDNDSPDGDVVLGVLRPVAGGYEFQSNSTPGAGTENFGVRVHASFSVTGTDLMNDIGGTTFGTKTVSGDVFALFPAAGVGDPEIVNVVSILP
ncbi:MAG: hypothetical protein ACKVT0_12495 [Planctomycetaceae bacterium]